MECFNSQSKTQTPFTMLRNSIPDGERLSQEICPNVQNWGQVCVFQGKIRQGFRSFTTSSVIDVRSDLSPACRICLTGTASGAAGSAPPLLAPLAEVDEIPPGH